MFIINIFISKWCINFRKISRPESYESYSPDIKGFDSESISLRYLFYNCKSIDSLPDISNWNIERIKDLSYIFYGCSKLKSLPDISKWNIEN